MSNSSAKTFFDQYTARWNSYVSLIEIFEKELYFIEDIFNSLTNSETLKGKWKKDAYEIHMKYSFLRVMSQIWARHVVKPLLPKFKKKLHSLLNNFKDKMFELADNFDKEKRAKGFEGKLRNKYALDNISHNIFKQALLCILDMSINEKNIKMINNSMLSVDPLYFSIEQSIIKNTREFLKTLFMKYPVAVFIEVAHHHRNVICQVVVKVSSLNQF